MKCPTILCPSCRVEGIKTEMTEHRNLKNELIYVCPVKSLKGTYHFHVKRDEACAKVYEDFRAIKEVPLRRL